MMQRCSQLLIPPKVAVLKIHTSNRLTSGQMLVRREANQRTPQNHALCHYTRAILVMRPQAGGLFYKLSWSIYRLTEAPLCAE